MKTKLLFLKTGLAAVLLPVLMFLGSCSGTPLDESDADLTTRAANLISLNAPTLPDGYELGVEYRFYWTRNYTVNPGIPGKIDSTAIVNPGGPIITLPPLEVALTVSGSGNDRAVRLTGNSAYVTFYKCGRYTVTATYISEGQIHTVSKTIDMSVTAELETHNCTGPFMGTTACQTRLKFSSNDGHEDNLFLPFDVLVVAEVINENPPPAFTIPGIAMGRQTIYFNQSVSRSAYMPEDYIYPLRFVLYSVNGNPECNRITVTVTRQPSIR